MELRLNDTYVRHGPKLSFVSLSSLSLSPPVSEAQRERQRLKTKIVTWPVLEPVVRPSPAPSRELLVAVLSVCMDCCTQPSTTTTPGFIAGLTDSCRGSPPDLEGHRIILRTRLTISAHAHCNAFLQTTVLAAVSVYP